jgi:hypothetical protein
MKPSDLAWVVIDTTVQPKAVMFPTYGHSAHRQHLDRCITDAGYHGHNAPSDHKFKVHTSGQKRRLAAITLPMPAAMPSTPCSPPPATTFAASSHG